MPSTIRNQPKVVHTPKTARPEQAKQPATAQKAEPGMEQYRMSGNKTLSHVAQEAYGQASKWPEILKANPGIKMRDGHTPILKDGDYIRIPKLDKGWTPKNPVKDVTGQQPTAPVTEAKKADPAVTEAVDKVSKAYTNLEGKLNGMQQLTENKGLAQVQDALAERTPPKDQYLTGMTNDARTALEGINKDLGGLNADQRKQVDAALAEKAGQWKLSSQLMKPLTEGNAIREQFKDAKPEAIRSLASAGYSAKDIAELKQGAWNPAFNTVNAKQVVDMQRRLGITPTQMSQAMRALAEQKKDQPNAGRNYVDAALTSAWQTGVIHKNDNAAQLLQTLQNPSASSQAARDLATAIQKVLRPPPAARIEGPILPA